MLILDTSAVIEVLKGTSKGEEIEKYIENKGASITAFTIHELFVGIKENEIFKIQEFLASIRIFNFDSVAAAESSGIEKYLISKGKRVEESDVFIAGICLANNSKLITLDKGFLEIKGLDVKVF